MKKFTQKQQGISLIEVMLALTIGIILLLTLSSIYLTAQNASKERSTDEALDEAARQIFERLQYDLNNAGYVDPFDSHGGVLNATKIAQLSKNDVARNLGRLETGAQTPYQAVYGTNPVEGSDSTLTIRYQVKPETSDTHVSLAANADSGAQSNCLGEKVNHVENTYSLDSGNFRCNSQPIVSNIADLHFEYLVTPKAQTNATVFNSYSGLYTSSILSATDVATDATNSPLSWAGVIGVKVCVVVGAETLNKAKRQEVVQFQPDIPSCETGKSGGRKDGDTKLYRRYDKVLSIPNALYFTN